MTRRRDPHTMDLLAWTPPPVVARFDEVTVRAASWRDRIAKAVSATLEAASATMSREEIASAMSDWLGESVSKTMLDAYASQAKEDHTIPLLRMIALGVVTGDPRLLQLAAEPLDRAVIESRYLGAIDEAIASEQIEQLERIRKAGRRQWRSVR